MKKKRMKKRILFFLIALAIVFIIILCIFLLSSNLKSLNDVSNKKPDHFYLPSYDENIFQNKAYMSFQRDLIFSTGGVDQVFTMDEYETVDAECQFFLKYFETVINGNFEKYPDFFYEGSLKDDPKFTMQMIYDPYAKFHSTSVDMVDGNEVELLNFQVHYKIFKNNGTFRNDIPSNTAIPQIYQLIKVDDGSYKIFKILDIEVVE